jgi:hypothetical protein
MAKIFGDFGLFDFWEPSEYGIKEYVGRPLDDATVRSVERELGFKLPASYVEFMKFQKAGFLVAQITGPRSGRRGHTTISPSREFTS